MLKNYLKVAFKVLLRRKFFTFISLFGISLTLLVLLVFTALADHIFSPQAPEVLAGRSLGIYSLGMQGITFRVAEQPNDDRRVGAICKIHAPERCSRGLNQIRVVASQFLAAVIARDDERRMDDHREIVGQQLICLGGLVGNEFFEALLSFLISSSIRRCWIGDLLGVTDIGQKLPKNETE